LRQPVRKIGRRYCIPSPLPLTDREFSNLMSAMGPFEARPTIAVGVSGGPDSLCLALLLKAWAREVGGAVIGLIVDHRLRPESAFEASKVRAWLTNYGVESRTLVWGNEPLKSGQQARARTARYNLLIDWCRTAHVLHLALGHHRDDQAETLLMRRERSSGEYGLAAMPAIREQGSVRLIRPFLGVSASRLRATLRGLDQEWVCDPSNYDPKYTRSRIRKSLLSEPTDLRTRKLSQSARMCAKTRNVTEQKVSKLLVKSTQIHSEGYAVVDIGQVLSQPQELVFRALSSIIWSLGGHLYAPRQASVARLVDKLKRQRVLPGYTLGGCFLRSLRDKLFVCREPIAARASLDIRTGAKVLWDSRFLVELKGEPTGKPMEYKVRALSKDGWQILRNHISSKKAAGFGIPFFAAYALPSLWSLDGLVSVPHLDYVDHGNNDSRAMSFHADYRPSRPLAGALFQGIGCHVASKTIK